MNAPDQCVVSGGTAALDEITALLREQGTRVDLLAVSHAFHSPLMAEVYDDFRAALDGITFHEPTITLISNVTGRPARLRRSAPSTTGCGTSANPCASWTASGRSPSAAATP
ncbi:acyltransferase domain-containing protein [Streptomyces zhihengii]